MAKNILKTTLILILISLACPSKSADKKQVNTPIDFTLTSIDGEEFTLSKLKGKVVLIDFWSIRCPPCMRSIPVFVKLYNKLNDQNFIVLGISLDGKSIIENARKDLKITYPLLIGNIEVAKAYNVQYIPTVVIIDKKGKIRKRQVGFAPELEAVFESLVDSLINE
jgi:peroxiredoxin